MFFRMVKNQKENHEFLIKIMKNNKNESKSNYCSTFGGEPFSELITTKEIIYYHLNMNTLYIYKYNITWVIYLTNYYKHRKI